jgi:hypothetical protein
MDSDEETPLVAPFCTFQRKCFNGILGSVTPYGGNFQGKTNPFFFIKS